VNDFDIRLTASDVSDNTEDKKMASKKKTSQVETPVTPEAEGKNAVLTGPQMDSTGNYVLKSVPENMVHKQVYKESGKETGTTTVSINVPESVSPTGFVTMSVPNNNLQMSKYGKVGKDGKVAHNYTVQIGNEGTDCVVSVPDKKVAKGEPNTYHDATYSPAELSGMYHDTRAEFINSKGEAEREAYNADHKATESKGVVIRNVKIGERDADGKITKNGSLFLVSQKDGKNHYNLNIPVADAKAGVGSIYIEESALSESKPRSGIVPKDIADKRDITLNHKNYDVQFKPSEAAMPKYKDSLDQFGKVTVTMSAADVNKAYQEGKTARKDKAISAALKTAENTKDGAEAPQAGMEK
jgi:hypothetical protein